MCLSPMSSVLDGGDLDLYITPIERPQLALLQSAKGTFGKEEEDEIIERIGPWPGPKDS